MCYSAHMEVRGQSVGVVLSFHLAGSRDHTEAIKKTLFPLRHLTDPHEGVPFSLFLFFSYSYFYFLVIISI